MRDNRNYYELTCGPPDPGEQEGEETMSRPRTFTGDIVRELANTYGLGLSQERAQDVVDKFLSIVTRDLVNGRDVQLANLGTLRQTERRAKDTVFGRPNPQAGRVVRNITLRDSASLRQRMNG